MITSLDTETTTSNKGNPHDQTNKLCAVGVRVSPTEVLGAYKIEHDNAPYGEALQEVGAVLAGTTLLVGFNLKFDLKWLRKYGIEYEGKVWDCQLFEHFASNQTWVMPSLADSLIKRGISGTKVDELQTDFWDNGLNTTDAPWDLVARRVMTDADLTFELYVKQHEVFETWPRNRQNLFLLQCQDLLVLADIEYNGVYYAEEICKEEADKTLSTLLTLKQGVYAVVGADSGNKAPNLDSPPQVSALLYGGTIEHKWAEVVGEFKTGAKAGQPRRRWLTQTVEYPRLVEPLEGTALDHPPDEEPTHWSTDKGILARLLWKRVSKKAKAVILLLQRIGIESKALTSAFVGLPKLRMKMNWPKNMLFGNINQVVVRTGRTSSSNPNLQNFDGELKHIFKTRFL